MLIATYALLTLYVEQNKERGIISRIRHYLQAHAGRPHRLDPARLQVQLDELAGFAEARHQHKVKECLMPAVRHATHEADHLLADLESLNRVGSNMLRSVRRRLHLAFAKGGAQIRMLVCTLERYCENVLERLAKEEQELLPLAQRVFSSEQWFDVGTMFLSHDARHAEQRRRLNQVRLLTVSA
ncbi:MAG TPA: hypothetical protein DCW29_01440 [Janthinobacterium sp.]|nr:hypothetical protein [Janthinobacterium sp.]